MNPETKSSSRSLDKHTGSIELLPSQSAVIQFTGHRQTFGCPKSDLRQMGFTLTEIRRQHPDRQLPPQQLFLSVADFTVTLAGWRLESLPGLLADGKIARIRAVAKTPDRLAVEGPLVSHIRICWRKCQQSLLLLPPKALQ
jgi:hypothetical protein